MHLLTPLAALDEVVATTTSVIEGRGDISDADRRSLGHDVATSLRSLGPGVQVATAAVLRAFQSTEVGPLARLLTDVEGAQRLRSAARILADELCLARTLEAAWDDCVVAFRDDAPSATCELRLAQLRELSTRRGHSWDALERRLRELLADRLHIAVALGAVEVDLADADPLSEAGLSLDRRIELCREQVGGTPVESESVVWLAYGSADLKKGFARCGPVQFFTHRLPLDAIRDGCPALDTPDFERPQELADHLGQQVFSNLPDEPYVLVRVKVPAQAIADVRAYARDIVSGLVAIASPDSGWVLLDGEAVYNDGGWWGTLGFTDPEEFAAARRAHDVLHEGTGEALTELDERFVQRWAEGDELAVAAVAERRWETTSAAAQDPAQAIALSMRILERALPVPRGAGESLQGACERYLLDAWSFRAFWHELFDAAYYGLASLRRAPEPAPALREQLWSAVFPSTGELSFRFEHRIFLAHIQDVLSALPTAIVQHRAVREVAATTLGAAPDTLAHLAELDGRFRCLLARAIRQRNAVVHGAATVPAVVRTCEAFIRDLCSYVVSCTIAAVIDEEQLLEHLEHARAAWLRQRESISRGNSPADVVFSGNLRDAGI
jgi:hypothetical protein